MKGYINLDKRSEIWVQPHPEEELNFDILRTVCSYYSRERLVTAILTSKKLIKSLHLKARRQLLRLLSKSATKYT